MDLDTAAAEPKPRPAGPPFLKYKELGIAKVNRKFVCPFCLRAAPPVAAEMLAHLSNCPSYDPFGDGLPLGPASAVAVDDDLSLELYFQDELAFFDTCDSLLETGVLRERPTENIEDLREFIDSYVTLAATGCVPFDRKRRRSLVWRVISMFYEMPEDVVQMMLEFLVELEGRN